jgi:hypothetical protein
MMQHGIHLKQTTLSKGSQTQKSTRYRLSTRPPGNVHTTGWATWTLVSKIWNVSKPETFWAPTWCHKWKIPHLTYVRAG